MDDTGQVCKVTGVYRSSDCNGEILLNKGEKFPPCPTHGREVMWNFERPS
jgi:hypothetical protein